MDFNSIMRDHSDEKLIEILQKRNDYQKEAIDAALLVAKERGLIKSDEPINKFDLKQDLTFEISEIINDLGNVKDKTVIILKNIGIIFLVLNILPLVSGVIDLVEIIINGLDVKSENPITYFMGTMLTPLSSLASIWLLSLTVKHLKKNDEFTLAEVIQYKLAIGISTFLSSLLCVLLALLNITSPSLILGALTLIYTLSLLYIYKLNLLFFKETKGSWFNNIRLIILLVLVLVACSIFISILYW